MRVFLPTYRRAGLLPRAVESLRAQTVTDWICELHNDDPTDPFPAQLVQHLADPRIQLVQHARNLGPIETFNRFYQPTAEPFYTLLEDDNTWDSTFLETLLAALVAHPQATLAWCNQRIVREESDGRIQETGTLANPPGPANSASAPASSAQLQSWGHLRQVMGALHANGAMLLRSRPGETYATPQIPFGCVEAFRERMFPHPLLYLPQALATFTITRQTARRRDQREWSAALTALAATYVKHAHLSSSDLARLCEHFREQRPPMTTQLITAALACRDARSLLPHLTTRDWLRFLFSFARHPLTTFHALRVHSRHPDWWKSLDHHTATRFSESHSRPFASLRG